MTEQEWNKLNERKLKDWSVLRSFMDANPQMSYESLLTELRKIAEKIHIETANELHGAETGVGELLYMRELLGWKEILTLLDNRYL